jgi:hypothetical protein
MSIADKATISTLQVTIKNLELILDEESKRNVAMFHAMCKNADAILSMQPTVSKVKAGRDRYKAEAVAWKRRCEAAEKVIYGIEKGYDEENMAEVYDSWRQQIKDMEVKG